MTPIETRWFLIESTGIAPVGDGVPAFADAILDDLAARLDVTLEGWTRPRLVLGADRSEVVGDTVRVEAKEARGSCSEVDWLELLLRHELTHLLIERHWGMAPTLFWEGVPVHLGDDFVRQRLHGRDYADRCRELAASGRLLNFEGLIAPDAYYRRRSDYRVDMQAGAFCGWLLDVDPGGLRRLFAIWPDDPSNTQAALVSCFGVGLGELETGWRGSLV